MISPDMLNFTSVETSINVYKTMRHMKLFLVGLFTMVVMTLSAQITLTTQPNFDCTGDSVCIDIEVTNFTNIAGLAFAITYDETALMYSSRQDHLPGSPTFNSTVAGVLRYVWSGSATTVANGDSVVTFCFQILNPNVIANPLIQIVDLPPTVVSAFNSMLMPVSVAVGPQVAAISNDVTPPMITCPGDVTVNAPMGSTTATVNNLTAIFSDDCLVQSIGYSMTGAATNSGNGTLSSFNFPIGTTTLTYTVIDYGGNAVPCNMTIVVNGPPPAANLILDIDDITVECDQDPVFVSMDVQNFDMITEAEFGVMWNPAKLTYVGFTEGLPGVPTVNTANTGTGLFSIDWSSLVPQSLTSGTVILILEFDIADPSEGTNPVEFAPIPVPAFAGVGGVSIPPANVTLLDGSVTIEDNTPPMITCPMDMTANAPMGMSSAMVSGLEPAISDNCDLMDTTYTLSGAVMGSGSGVLSSMSFPIGTTTVTYVATDGGNNPVMCSFTVTVNGVNPNAAVNLDIDDITIDCDADPVFLDVDAVQFSMLTGAVFAINWDPVVLGYVNVVENLPGSPTINMTNVGAGELIIAWSSGTPETITSGTAILTLEFDILNPAETTTAVVFGNTPTPSFTDENVIQLPGSAITLQDGSVTIGDNDDPMITCPAGGTFSTMNMAPVIVNGLNAAASDNCCLDNVTYSFSGAMAGMGTGDPSGTSFPVGTTTITYVANDCNGGSAMCTTTITVNDNTAPLDTLILSVENRAIECDSGMVTIGINADNFTDVAGLRFAIMWDPNGVGVRKFQLTTTWTSYNEHDKCCKRRIDLCLDKRFQSDFCQRFRGHFAEI